jgi:hypothetical protein
MGDEREAREYVRVRLPDGKALDKDDLALAFDESSQRSLYRAVRRAALDWVMEHMADRFIVRPGFAEELMAYVAGTGEYPDDAKAITGEEQLARRITRLVNPTDVVKIPGGRITGGETDRAKIRAELDRKAHEGPPDEEGRYPGQEPRGRFARAGDSSFEPDSR